MINTLFKGFKSLLQCSATALLQAIHLSTSLATHAAIGFNGYMMLIKESFVRKCEHAANAETFIILMRVYLEICQCINQWIGHGHVYNEELQLSIQ